MRTVSRALAVALLLAAAPATLVLAQPGQGTAGEPPAVEQQKSSPETRQRLQDGKLAMAKAALKLTDEQAKLWAPVETRIQADWNERTKAREERRARRDENKDASKEERRAKRASLPERMEQMSKRMAERAAKMQAMVDVLKPFYGSLTEEQKAVAGPVLRELGVGSGGKGDRGGRWAGGWGKGRHHD